MMAGALRKVRERVDLNWVWRCGGELNGDRAQRKETGRHEGACARMADRNERKFDGVRHKDASATPGFYSGML